MKRILVLNGPNINILGLREPEIYGRRTYRDLVELVTDYGNRTGTEVICFQSNHEGDLVDRIQQALTEKIDGIVINPAAYTHTSIAIADAIKGVCIPTVEVHISDISTREPYRNISYVRETVIGAVIGEGLEGYCRAMDMLTDWEKTHEGHH